MAIVVDDFKTPSGVWVKGYRIGTPQYITKSGRLWDNMSMRCKEGGATQKNCVTYIGCTMSENFKDFQFFANWHVAQAGYDKPLYHFDKDILVSGNRVYSEDTSVLVPRELNLFLGDRKAARGQWPQGVHFHKGGQKFCAAININGKSKYLGLYANLDTACKVYKDAKDAEAYRWYTRLSAGEFVVDERVIERMKNWEHICDWKPND